jgi:hypothetical protein
MIGSTFFCEGCTVLKNQHCEQLHGPPLPRQCYIDQGQLQVPDLEYKGKDFQPSQQYMVGVLSRYDCNQPCMYKARSPSPLTISSGQAVMVQPRCHIPTMDHLITADESEEMEVHCTCLDWTMLSKLQTLFIKLEIL